MRVPLAAVSLLCLVLASCGRNEPVSVDGTIDVGTHSLEVRVRGQGSPAVVVDSGLGGRLEEWRNIQDALTSEALVVAYNRAGYGASGPGPLPRDSATEADELKALLETLSVPGPYVLLGHSLGGLNAQVFAARYPEDVAGLVLLDPPPLSWILGNGYPELRKMADQMTAEWQGIADRGAASSDARERAQASLFQMLASEHREMFGASARQAAAIETFGAIPVTVIASGVPNPLFGEIGAEYQEFWAGQSRAVAAKSGRGEFLFVEDSSHNLHEEARDVVISSTLAMVAGHGRD